PFEQPHGLRSPQADPQPRGLGLAALGALQPADALAERRGDVGLRMGAVRSGHVRSLYPVVRTGNPPDRAIPGWDDRGQPGGLAFSWPSAAVSNGQPGGPARPCTTAAPGS